MLTNLQNQMLYGAILGNSHVQFNGNSTRVRFDRSIKQRDYIKWKYQILTIPLYFIAPL